MRKFAILLCALLVLAFATTAQAAPKHRHHHRRHHHVTKVTPPPVNLVPHTISVYGNFTSVCYSIGCQGPFVSTSVAECPAGYTVIGGGWETFANEAPVGASVTENHSVSNRWIVTMEALPSPGDPPRFTPAPGRFVTVAQCQILLPA